jgi:hypothetical protein
MSSQVKDRFSAKNQPEKSEAEIKKTSKARIKVKRLSQRKV